MTTETPASPAGKEQVVLVHGTFASSAEDRGEAWWQIGSQAHQELQKRLPHQVELSAEGSLFRWSGDNTERARSKAASQLLSKIEGFEKSGQPYHLIGHSHGGSVIWSTLRLATARRKTLKQLRSWSTVGTPFLHHQSRSSRSPASIAQMIIAAMLLFPAFRCLKALVKLPYDVAMGNLDNGIIIAPDREVGLVSALARVPVLKGLELLGVPFTPTAEGTRLGSFDPASGQSVGHFLFGTLEGWLILGAILLFGYVMLLLGSLFLSSVSEGLRIGWEKRLEQRAFDTYRERWLGIWTEDDEAINGLRATMELSVSFVGNLVVRERIFVSDLISLPWRPIHRLFAPIYNAVLRPVLDTAIREIVVKTAQGNDRPSARVVAVSPHPILPPPTDSAPPLPAALRARICQQADGHANELGPKLRVLLAQPSVTAGLDGFSHALSGRELVHTSYFDHDEVIDLLSLNISWARGRRRPHRSSNAPETERWFKMFKQLQCEGPNSGDDSQGNSIPQSVEPSLHSRRRAA